MNHKKINQLLNAIEETAKLQIQRSYEVRQLLAGDVHPSPARKGGDVIPMDDRIKRRERRKNFIDKKAS